MPTAADKCQPVEKRMSISFPKYIGGVEAHDPIAIVCVPVDWRIIKGVTPLNEGANRVWMRNCNGADAAQQTDSFHGGIVDQTNAIP